MADHLGEISLGQGRAGRGAAPGLQVWAQGRSERGRVCRGNKSKINLSGIVLLSPGLFRNVLESVLRDRVEHLLDLSAGGQELGQNSLHSDLGGLGARTANSCDKATGVSGNVQLTQWEGL